MRSLKMEIIFGVFSAISSQLAFTFGFRLKDSGEKKVAFRKGIEPQPLDPNVKGTAVLCLCSQQLQLFSGICV